MEREDSPYPMLVVGASGAVERANAAARALLGGARDVPAWLARAHGEHAAGPVTGPVGERVFEAHPVRDDGAGRVEWWLVDVTERHRAGEAVRAERDALAAAVEVSSELLATLNLDRCLEAVARLAVRHLAVAARVVLPRAGHRHVVTCCEAGDGTAHLDLTREAGTMPGLSEALRGFPPVPPRWLDPATAPAWVTRGAPAGIGSIVVLALPGYGLPAGALILLRRSEHHGFTPSEALFAPLFTARAGTAISIARLYAEQAAITETLMADLLPPVMTHVDGVEVAARYRAAGDSAQVGGDFYDVHAVAGAGRRSLVVLGDVSGKGLEAAVLTGKIRNTLRALLPLSDDHQRVLNRLNDVLLAADGSRFVTLVLAGVERRGGRVVLRLTSAGHPPPMIVRFDGRVQVARTRGTLIGLLEHVTSVTEEVLLEPGDTCLLYSDGVIEARGGPFGGELFGEERLEAELRRCAGMPADSLAERVQMLASQWAGGGERDDLAIVAIGVPREQSRNGAVP
ncbi:Stage II sporulation protein E (SpoIIE) [Nonomuraea coxensis DSM 45129]|uniref:Stage II sporulation protein E (SpoIIE) n=1 Tax=Nonomuraea coxensis DSM 45129 TaxID=1122611 RepID=A0ABX8U2M3_9ACTN|nr:PP2C family protein-serine/threonine phosphatase [Nonomuraea coxensis]QYC40994.1 Stage II sporulation protein E (SpoIIE) [Nonomuraea coxensis DSM 45129]